MRIASRKLPTPLSFVLVTSEVELQFTVIVAVAGVLSPLPMALVAPRTSKLKVVVGLARFRFGVNFNPAAPSAMVMAVKFVI